MCDNKTRTGGIRTLRVGRRQRMREKISGIAFCENLLLNFQAGALLGRVTYVGMGGNQRYNETFVSRLFLEQQVHFKGLPAM